MSLTSLFTIRRRNYGHWDIHDTECRIFRVRGGPGSYVVVDDRQNIVPSKQSLNFKTVGACMTYICDELMYELIVAEGQEPAVIEAWNI